MTRTRGLARVKHWWTKPRVFRSALIALIVSAFPTYHELVRGLAHDTNTIETIMIRVLATFLISFTLVFLALVAGGLQLRRDRLEVGPWFAWFFIGAAILYVPGMIIFRHWAGSLVVAAGWLVVLAT